MGLVTPLLLASVLEDELLALLRDASGGRVSYPWSISRVIHFGERLVTLQVCREKEGISAVRGALSIRLLPSDSLPLGFQCLSRVADQNLSRERLILVEPDQPWKPQVRDLAQAFANLLLGQEAQTPEIASA